METVDEARKIVFETGRAILDDPDSREVAISLVAVELGMDEETAEELEEMSLILDERASEYALLQLIQKGDGEAAARIQSGAIGTAALIGYRLGCAHTAERATNPEQ